ncbi:hypothetical protein AB0L53_50610 [Nonomuraea sp. NPDC052129]|uniref:hypothetical protein n=1 Tax=unclassified Nonomuraea TaxID=2593643 RepID=UPI003411A203
MAVTRIDWHWFSAWGNGYHTVDVNLPPALVGTSVSLYGATGGGTQYAGIKHFRRRLDSGADQDVDFGEWPSWPPLVFDRVSSVTLAIATGTDQTGWLLARLDFWG